MKEIFEKVPETWGLRGDPYLWNEMEIYFSSIKEPECELLFTIHFYKAFKRITGEALESGKTIFVDQYNLGGMSSGMVDANFWLQVALPLLLDRFRVKLKNRVQ